MTHEARRALDILESYGDPACYEEIAQTIRRGAGRVIAARELGVLVHHTRADLYMLAGEANTMESLCDCIPSDASDILIHGDMPPQQVQDIRKRFGRDHVLPFILYAYYGALPPKEEAFDIRVLGVDALDFLYENYGHATRDYLAQRLDDGVMIGAYVDGELAAFIGEHVEGAMGLLHVMPQFRRHHMGFALERADIRTTMLRGNVPFCQVAPGNQASRSLQARLGMTQARQMLYWITDESF